MSQVEQDTIALKPCPFCGTVPTIRWFLCGIQEQNKTFNTNQIDFLSKTTFVKSSELCCKTIFRSDGLVGCMK